MPHESGQASHATQSQGYHQGPEREYQGHAAHEEYIGFAKAAREDQKKQGTDEQDDRRREKPLYSLVREYSGEDPGKEDGQKQLKRDAAILEVLQDQGQAKEDEQNRRQPLF